MMLAQTLQILTQGGRSLCSETGWTLYFNTMTGDDYVSILVKLNLSYSEDLLRGWRSDIAAMLSGKIKFVVNGLKVAQCTEVNHLGL